MLAELSKGMTRLPGAWFGLATVFLAVASIGGMKVGLRVLLPDDTWVAPYYGIALAAAVLLPGLPDSSWRGLATTAVASSIGAISLVALAVLQVPRWDVFVFALPITIVGAVGLGVFAHGILHAAPGVARIGFQAILVGYAASVVLAIVAVPIISPFISVRNEVHGTDPATLALAAVAILSGVVAVLIVIVGLRRLEAKA